MSDEEFESALRAAYLLGFSASSEGNNWEYPFRQCGINPAENENWLVVRDKELAALIPLKDKVT